MVAYNWIIIGACVISLVQCESCNSKDEPKCRISRIHKMKSADCFHKDIIEFPQCLPADVEILDLTYNRIRKLTKSTLEKYSNLKILYLGDNAIASIKDNAFEDLDNLHTLDLSINGILKVPPAVLQLPSLKSLYLGKNFNINIADSVEKAKPITNSLVHLDISSTSPDTEAFLPDLGVLPLLMKFNISGNKFTGVSTKQFAGLCSLNNLDSANVTADFDDSCDCWRINFWLQQRKVVFTPLECGVNVDECPDPAISDKDLAIYKECRESVESLITKSRLMTILIPIGVIVGLLLICLAYFCIRRRRQRAQKNTNRKPQKDGQQLLTY